VNGDNDAFGLLFTRHKDRLWAVAVRTLGDPEEAADALQDAMISAFRQASGFRGDSAVTTWLHRIVVNACLDRLRRRAARPTVSGLDERAMDVLSPGPAGTDAAAAINACIGQTPAHGILELTENKTYVLDEQDTRWATTNCSDLVNYKFTTTDAPSGAIDLVKE